MDSIEEYPSSNSEVDEPIKWKKVSDILLMQFPMTPSPFTFTLIQGSNDLLMKKPFPTEAMKIQLILKTSKRNCKRSPINEILKWIRHELLWNEEEWKLEDSVDADMQIDEVPDYVATSNQANDNYYDPMHSSMLTRKKRERLIQKQR